MLNPVDTDSVIRDGGATGRFPGEIHEGVAWWVGACFVVVRAAGRLGVGHDGHPATTEFTRRFCKGAINARHFRCAVCVLGTVTDDDLVTFLRDGRLPGARLSTGVGADGTLTVTMRLYDEAGEALREETGLAAIRRMIAEDRVPIPVSAGARGTVRYLGPPTPGTTVCLSTADGGEGAW
jgi:hypothetical protein